MEESIVLIRFPHLSTRIRPQKKRKAKRADDRFRLIALIAFLPANPPLLSTFILQRIQLLARLAVIIMSVKRVLVIAGSDSSGGA
jgi:hypothetical protein